jgi:hypothetical protein
MTVAYTTTWGMTHGLLDDEVAEIVTLYHEWGEIDRSHRKLAYRGSYLERVWVSPSSVRRVLADHGLHLHPPPRPGRSARTPFPDRPATPDIWGGPTATGCCSSTTPWPASP